MPFALLLGGYGRDKHAACILRSVELFRSLGIGCLLYPAARVVQEDRR